MSGSQAKQGKGQRSAADPRSNVQQQQQTHVLTSDERRKLESFALISETIELLRSFGYSLDDVRCRPDGSLAMPLVIEESLNNFKNARMTAFTKLTVDFIGMSATLFNLSEQALNGKSCTIVKVFPDDDKVCVDVTPDDWPAQQVRYVLVSTSKIWQMQYAATTNDSLNCCACVSCENRDDAFAAAGFDPLNLEYLAVRPHPEVEIGRMWRDVPLVCAKLNRERVPGYPFRLEIGLQVFGKTETDCARTFSLNVEELKEYTTVYTTEPYMIMRDARGNGIDIAPDIAPLIADLGYGRSNVAHLHNHKLYIADAALTQQTWTNVCFAIFDYVEWGWLPTAPHMEEFNAGYDPESQTIDRSDNATSLGMIRGDLNQSWPDPARKVVMCNHFLDSAIDPADKAKLQLHAGLIDLRRQSVLCGDVLLSRNLACDLAQRHTHDHFGGCILNRNEVGTICFGCYTRLTVEESKVCNGCGIARYCSRGCQVWHWPQHQVCCASKEERSRRRQSRAAAAAARAEQLRRHEEREAQLRAEAAAKEAARKAQAARARAERAVKRANEVTERICRAAPQPRKLPTGKGKRASTEQLLLHQAWDSNDERAARTAAFMAKQEAEHLATEAAKQQKKADALKKLAADASAAHEAATHCVPCAPTLLDAMGKWDATLYD